MSKATKRKHVTKEVTEDYVLPKDGLYIVRVLCSRGNNLHEVKDEKGENFLVSMPTKFRKNVWIKRDDFVMIKSIAEGDKVKAEIEHILYKPQIEYIRDQGLWPKEFDSKDGRVEKLIGCIPDDMLPPEADSSDDSDVDDESTADIVCNPNRRTVEFTQDSSDSEDSDTDDKVTEAANCR